MFDVAPAELVLVALVALVVIGPKDLPKAMRVVGNWVGKARNVARHFRSGIDEMVRQSEMEEMEKKWAAENARIMAETSILDKEVAPTSSAGNTPFSPEHENHSAADPASVESSQTDSKA